jgi:4-oxalocrotonate tautomerase
MPFVNIQIVKEVIAADPAGKKAEISKAVTAATGLAREDVWVVFEEVAARDWYLGDTSVESLRYRK